MSFQWVFDNAESISIVAQPTVLSTTSIDGTLRTTSLGAAPWRFEVALPAGPRWDESRIYIAEIEALDRHTSGNIQLSNTGYTSWLNAYLGDAANTAGVTANVPVSGNTITLTAGLTVTSGQYRLRAGDYIQLGSSGSVYRVAADVPFGSNTVTLHRPIIDDPGTGVTVLIGPAVTWRVRCQDFPTWTIFSRNQVSWSGSFIFVEDLT